MHRPAIRSIYWVGLASMAIFVMASSGPECSKATTDTLGPSLESLKSPIAQCKKDCVDTKNDRLRDEKDRYWDAKADCNGDRDCLKREKAIHEGIVAEIIADKDKCQAACEHEQGSAAGGQ